MCSKPSGLACAACFEEQAGVFACSGDNRQTSAPSNTVQVRQLRKVRAAKREHAVRGNSWVTKGYAARIKIKAPHAAITRAACSGSPLRAAQPKGCPPGDRCCLFAVPNLIHIPSLNITSIHSSVHQMADLVDKLYPNRPFVHQNTIFVDKVDGRRTK